MTAQDGLDHRRMRNMVNRAFTLARVTGLAPRVEEITASLIDDMVAAGDKVDLVPAFGEALPIMVIWELFGIPEEDRAPLRTRTQSIVTASEQAVEAQVAMFGYLTRFAERRRGDLRDDLTSMLIKAQEDGEVTLSDNELAGLLLLFVTAGYEITTHLLGNAVVALSLHSEQRDLAIRDGLWEQVVEETLRPTPRRRWPYSGSPRRTPHWRAWICPPASRCCCPSVAEVDVGLASIAPTCTETAVRRRRLRAARVRRAERGCGLSVVRAFAEERRRPGRSGGAEASHGVQQPQSGLSGVTVPTVDSVAGADHGGLREIGESRSRTTKLRWFAPPHSFRDDSPGHGPGCSPGSTDRPQPRP